MILGCRWLQKGKNEFTMTVGIYTIYLYKRKKSWDIQILFDNEMVYSKSIYTEEPFKNTEKVFLSFMNSAKLDSFIKND